MSADSSERDCPFPERPTPDRYKPNALELAKVAAAIDPELAKRKPAEAVRIARNLISAAQDEIEEPSRRHNDEVAYWPRAREKRTRERLFPTGECITVAEAFKR
ncbi:MAG: hypothetical protein M3N48_12940, partial [Verrucomicrobiota bacterium]|nr:hypothetical protein [Verrucomicrobiota bacterium]